MTTQNFDNAKEIDQDYDESEYYVMPSRAEFYYEDGMEEPVEIDEDGQIPPAETETQVTQEQAPTYDDELAAALAAQNQPTQEQTPEVTADPDFARFNEDFKKYAGVDFKEAMESFKFVQQKYHEQAVNEQKRQLATEWGVEGDEFESRLTQVRDRWSRLKPELQKQYDTNEGIKLIWTHIENEQAKNQKQVPGLQRSSTKIPAGMQAKYDFTQRQIDKMSNEEYAKNAGRIMTAYANGRVKP